MSELKQQIELALKLFSGGAPRNCARKLLNVLGYDSDKTDDIEPNTFQGFKDYFLTGQNSFNEQSAKADEWQSMDIIFQLTDEELKRHNGLFSVSKVDNRIIESYLFLVIKLKGFTYSRTDLVKITREINKLTPMPSMLFFRYGDCLTIAAIDRRLHKKDESRDVLEKVTLIKDINVAHSHRAHIEILHDLALANLSQKQKIDTFVEGKHLDIWLPASNLWLEWGTERAPAKFCRPTFPQLYEVEEKILAQRSPGPDPKVCLDTIKLVFSPSSVGFVLWHTLSGVRNNSLKKRARYKGEKPLRVSGRLSLWRGNHF